MRAVDISLSVAACLLEIVEAVETLNMILPVTTDPIGATDRTIHTDVLPVSCGTIWISCVLMLHSFTSGMALRWVLVKKVFTLPAWRIGMVITILLGMSGTVIARLAW